MVSPASLREVDRFAGESRAAGRLAAVSWKGTLLPAD